MSRPATRPLPPDDELERWYKCERKVALLTEPIAALACAYSNKAYYPCPFGDHWHMGRRVHGGNAHHWRRHAKRAWWRARGLI